MTQRLAIFTICSCNYLAYARVLFASIRAQHPEAELFLCLADRVLAADTTDGQDWEVIPAASLPIPDFDAFAFRYSVVEFNTALKPFMFLHLLEQRQFESVLYFDPDIQVFGRLDAELDRIATGAAFVLTPHILEPLETEEEPDDITIMSSGIFNLGFLGASNGEESRKILRWWSRRVLYQCLDAKADGLFVDQKFIDLVPAFTPDCYISRNPGLNVAYWNLSQRDITRPAESWLVNGEKLIFFHFSGFDPMRPLVLSKHTARYRSGLPPALRELMAGYVRALRRNGYRQEHERPYGFGAFASGTPINPFVRAMFRDGIAGWTGNPFESFEAFLHAASPAVDRGPDGYVVTNFMAYLRNNIPTLKQCCDVERPEGRRALVLWYVHHAASAIGLDERTIHPVTSELARQGVMLDERLQAEVAASLPAPDELVAMIQTLRGLRRRFVPRGSLREWLLRAAYRMVARKGVALPDPEILRARRL